MRTTTNKHWLNIAEYVSLAGSVAGSVASIASQQVVYAAAPVTLALSLSLANRQRLHSLQQQHTSSAIADVRQVVQSLDDIQALPSQSVDLSAIYQTLSQHEEATQAVTKTQAAIADLGDRLNALAEKFNTRPEPQAVEQLQQRFQIISFLASEISKSQLKQQQFGGQLGEMKKSLENLDVSATDLHDYTRQLKQEVENWLIDLDERTQMLSQTPQQLEEIRILTTDLKETTAVLNKPTQNWEFSHQVDTAVERRVAEMNQLLKKIQPAYDYELVFDRSDSRRVLLEALQKAQHRLILVCPWLTYYGADSEVIQMCKKLLQKGVRLEIGWGNLKDINDGKVGVGFFYNALGAFEDLRESYPQLCQMKLLGTHEKFLVCDRSFAMIGSHNFLTSGTSSSEREVGLRTNDTRLIENLIWRFESAKEIQLKQEQYRSLSYV